MLSTLFDGTFATGSYVSQPGQIIKRSKDNSGSDDECSVTPDSPIQIRPSSSPSRTESPNDQNKRLQTETSFYRKRTKENQYDKMADAITSLAESLSRPPPNLIQNSSARVLQKDYADKYTLDELIKGLKILENKDKSNIFMSLEPGELRDIWLYREIRGHIEHDEQ